MKEKYFYVYKWFNIDTNEIFYIGKGCQNRYKETSKRNKTFLEYYHNNNCDSSIIEYFDNEDEAFKKEAELIAKYKEIGQACANLDAGGKGGCHFIWTKEMRDYMSKYNPMKDPKQKERFSKNNPMKNPEIAEKVAQKNRRAVIIDGQLFNSVIEASRQLHKAEPTIRVWCKRGYDTNGNPCRYEDEEQKEIPKKVKTNLYQQKTVIIDEEYFFNSIKEAASFIGCTHGALGKALKNNKLCKGHKCKYANQQPSQTNSWCNLK